MRLRIERGAYYGTTDDRADRWYIVDRDAEAVDRRGPGHATRREAREARDLILWRTSEDAIECQCTSGCCTELATTTNECLALCEGCTEYAVDDDGEVHCAHCDDDVEYVTEGYYRLRPPEMPAADPAGAWSCYWATALDDEGPVSRHATRDDAEQAVAAHDWPPPGDRTDYRCGYEVRRLVDGRWVDPDEEDAVA